MISKSDLTTEIKYTGTKDSENMFSIIGYVDIKHGDNLVFHHNLTVRSLEELNGKTPEEIDNLYVTEANEILGGECAEKCCEQYIFLVNNGLY